MANPLQFSFRQKTYRISFKKSIFLFSLFFFILFCVLGNWQLHRYAYKKSLLNHYTTQFTGPEKKFDRLLPSLNADGQLPPNMQFQKTSVVGEYLNTSTILIQNVKYHDRIGFEVLTPFKLAGSTRWLLVDRGWVVESSDHSPPTVSTALGERQIKGYIKFLNERQFILGPNILNTAVKPLTIQKIDITELERVMQARLYPFVLRLSPTEENGFIRDWTINVSPPSRHMGYAIQWFAMALVLFIAYLSFSIERVRR